MEILSGIVEKEDRFLDALKKLGGQSKTYVYGDGLMGRQVRKRLALHGIAYAGTVVDRKYWNKESGNLCLEELLETTDRPVNLIIAFKGHRPESLARWKEKTNAVVEMDCWAGIDIASDEDELTYGWLEEKAEEFQALLDLLRDRLSQDTLFAYLNQKISSDYKYLETVRQPCQYFDEEICKMSAHEVFVDCGAYDGDSAADFVNALRRRGYDSYDGIISFEPDPDNFKKLESRRLENHACIQKGVGREEKILRLSKGGTASMCKEDGEVSVEVDSIDHVMGGKRVTMIKMDIEGFELDALHGAKDTIRRCRPLLAVCVYHKRDDLLTIPQYIKSVVPEYRFYLRAYDRSTLELVLYAACTEK